MTIGDAINSPHQTIVLDPKKPQSLSLIKSTEQWMHHEEIGYFIWDKNKQVNVKVESKTLNSNSVPLYR